MGFCIVVNVKTFNKVFSQLFKIFLGAVFALAIIIFLIISAPMYIIRTFVAFLARFLRPDFDNILNGQSSMYLCDYLAESPPRSNLVITNVFQNQLSHDEFKNLVLKRLIQRIANNPKLKNPYRRFQQYPEHWLGFPFWKNGSESFCIDNHVHRLTGRETVVSSKMLTDIIEKLLNSQLPRKQSPWEFHVIENYKETPTSPSQGIAILKIHHTLADGYGVFSAIVEGLFENQSMKKLDFPLPNISTFSHCQSILNILMLPLNMLIEGSIFLSNTFTNIPLKIPDDKKKWHQHVARTDPISIQTIKNIKNACGVSFTSVVFSAVSAAINKSLKENNKDNWQDSIPCFRVLPIQNRSQMEALTNCVTGSVVNIPTRNFPKPLERLSALDKILQGKNQYVYSLFTRYYTSIAGQHYLSVCKLLSKNRAVPIALTNFPGLPHAIELNGNPYVASHFAMGGFSGDTGVLISVLSHNQEVRIVVAVEGGVMSKKQTNQFAEFITDEIQLLSKLTCGH